MVVDAVEFDGEVVGNARGVAKGGAEAVTDVEKGSIGPEEGDEDSADVVKGGWVGGMGRGDVVVWSCHDDVGGPKSNANRPVDKDIFFPEEGKGCIWEGWELGGRARSTAWLKAKAMGQMVMGLWAVIDWGRESEMVMGGSEAGIVNMKGAASGMGSERSLLLMLPYSVSHLVKGEPERW